MHTRSPRRRRKTTFFKSLFLSTSEQQRLEIQYEIERLNAISVELCRALEPIAELVQRKRRPTSSFYGGVQVLRALDTRKQRLELFASVENGLSEFNVQAVIDAPFVIQTNPVKCSESSHYDIASNNLEYFVGLFVDALRAEVQVQQ